MDGDIKNKTHVWQEIKEGAVSLRRYAEALRSRLDKLRDRHKAVGATWEGEQYDRMTDIVSDVSKSLGAKIEELVSLAKLMDEKADKLKAAEESGL